jgi:hypothetical protein
MGEKTRLYYREQEKLLSVISASQRDNFELAISLAWKNPRVWIRHKKGKNILFLPCYYLKRPAIAGFHILQSFRKYSLFVPQSLFFSRRSNMSKPSDKSQVKALQDELSSLRRDSAKSIGAIDKLAKYMGCADAKNDVKMLYLIALIRHVFRNLPKDKASQKIDTLLVAFNQHDEFKKFENVNDRRKAYYETYLMHKKILKSPENTLRRREDKSIKQIANYVLGTTNLPDILKKAVDADEEKRKKNLPPNPNNESPTIVENNVASASHPPKETCNASFPFHNSDLPARNEVFMWRDKQMGEIEERLLKGKMAVLAFGLGGMGKTQIALEYTYRWGEKHKDGIIWWINAEEFSTTMEAVEEFITYKQIAKREDGKAMLNAFLLWFERNGNWLMVFDNAKGYKEIAPFLPRHRSETGHILITTKLREGWGIEPIDVDVFSEGEAKWFLLKRTNSLDKHGQAKSEDEHGAERLAERLGYFPLALEQAGAYIALWKKEGVGFVEYMSELERRGVEILEPINDQADYMRSVKATIEIAIDKIMKESPRELLCLCAYFAPDNIDISFFTERPECLPGALREEITDGYTRLGIIKQLTQYSLVKYHNQTISIHRLVQEVIRDELSRDKDNSYVITCLKLVKHNLNLVKNIPDKSPIYPKNFSHCLSIIKYAKPVLTDNDTALLLIALGQEHLKT